MNAGRSLTAGDAVAWFGARWGARYTREAHPYRYWSLMPADVFVTLALAAGTHFAGEAKPMEAAFILKVALWIHDELVYTCPEAERGAARRRTPSQESDVAQGASRAGTTKDGD